MMLLICLLHVLGTVNAFSPGRAPTRRTHPAPRIVRCKPAVPSLSFPPSPASTTFLNLHNGIESQLSSSFLSPSNSLLLSQADASWRQYVPVVVIGLVLMDVLLGSPFANSLLNKARPDAMNDEDPMNNRHSAQGPGQEPIGSVASRRSSNPARAGGGKPRMDVDAYAKAALERAEGVTQLREYLDSRKTDWDRMEDMKRQMDQKMQELDRKNRNDVT